MAEEGVREAAKVENTTAEDDKEGVGKQEILQAAGMKLMKLPF